MNYYLRSEGMEGMPDTGSSMGSRNAQFLILIFMSIASLFASIANATLSSTFSPAYLKMNPDIINDGNASDAGTLPTLRSTSSPIVPSAGAFQLIVAITPGHQYRPKALWNVWTSGRYFKTSDYRYGRSLNGHSHDFTIGADRVITKKMIAGMMVTSLNSDSSNFNNNWTAQLNGLSAGPYLAYRPTQHWVMDCVFKYGQNNNDNTVLGLTGNYTSQLYATYIEAIGQYDLGRHMHIRPTPCISYVYNVSDPFRLNGNVLGMHIGIPVSQKSFALGLTGLTIEINRDFYFNKPTIVEPYVEIGEGYQFERPNNGQILTSGFTLVSTSPFLGLARVGVRALLTKALYAGASVADLTIGQGSLDVWEGKLYLSYAFG
jgi:hypothetical protein